MDLEQFMKLDRLPTAGEIVGLCESLGIGFGLNGEGQPVLKSPAGMRAEGKLVARLLSREPYRSAVIEAKGLMCPKMPPAIECRWNTGLIGQHWFPENGWPIGAWWWRHVGEADWKPIPGTPGETQQEPRWGAAS
jgi:hypothetical protein